MEHILSIDQGTTGSSAVLVGPEGQPLGVSSVDFPQYFPEPSWVEHDAQEIWHSVETAIKTVYRDSGHDPRECKGIGITNQRETIVFWDDVTQKPLCKAIVWQDRRTAQRCEELRSSGHADRIRQLTGLEVDPYFSATKIEWLLANNEAVKKAVAAGTAKAGTMDAYVAMRLTGEHVTDVSNASRTMLLDIEKLSYAPELLKLFGIEVALLPRVVDSSGVVGVTRGLGFLPDGIPVAGIAGDQQAALFGQTCFDPGDAKCTYGTGAFLLVNAGAQRPHSRHRLLSTVAWRIEGEVNYALEGSSFVAGAAVQWLRDGLGLINSASEVETLAESVSSSDGVVFVPALAGLGAPHWDPAAKGILCGLTRGTSKAHVARATLEGIAWSVTELASAMALDRGDAIARFRVDGGATENNLLMQLQADYLGVPVERPKFLESTALGAAFLAGLAVGFFESKSSLRKTQELDRIFSPGLSKKDRELSRTAWQTAVKRARLAD